MTLIVDVAVDDVRLPLGRERVRELARSVLRAERVQDALLSIAFVSSRRIAQLNRAHLGRAGPTDVISFSLSGGASRRPVVGDVYIAPDVARKNAHRYGERVRDELARVVVHGTLHVLGYDHPDGAEESAGRERTRSPMWRRQEQILARVRERVGW